MLHFTKMQHFGKIPKNIRNILAKISQILTKIVKFVFLSAIFLPVPLRPKVP